MKKSLFAVAAVTAFAGAAQAQSSVTVYGLLDVGYQGANYTLNNGTGVNTAALNAVQKTQTSAIGASAEQTSRLGFKGNEDMGGGLSSFFTIEMGLNPTYSNLSGASSVSDALQHTSQGSGSAIDNRQTFVGLKKNGLGEFALGRQYTPVFNAGAVTDPGQYNNTIGNVVYMGNSTYTGNTGNDYLSGFTNRADSAVTFKTASFAGFTASGLYALQNKNATLNGNGANATAGGNTNWNGWGLAADFTWQKLYLTAAYQSFKTQYTSSVVGAATVLSVNGAGPSTYISTGALVGWQPTNLNDKQTLVGATYDFGILKAYAQWVGRKVTENDSINSASLVNGASAAVVTGAQLNRTAEQIGVRSYITPTIEAWASGGMGTYTGPGAQAAGTTTVVMPASVRFTAYQLGSNYYLSKRTNLYAIYGQTQTSSGTANTVGAGSSANQYAVGMRHTF